MKTKQVYISDVNYDLLKNLNASSLVNELLNEHFRTKQLNSKEDLLKAKEEAELNALKLVEKTNEELEKIELKIKEVETIDAEKEATEEEKKAKKERKILNTIETAKTFFNVDLTRERAIQFLDSKYNTLAIFLKDGQTN
jgi:hypothetical protein